MSHREFKRRIKDAVNDPNLKVALDRAAAAYDKNRDEALEGVDFEAWRDHLRACKEASIARVPELFERFKHEAEQVGAQVHQAADSDEANRIVLELAQARNVTKVAKSKSMLTEEIELNQHLIAAGIEVTETDLGEWICQLAGEKPSHFTAPAIHKTREEIAELFSKATGEKVESDIPTLVGVARKEMRRAFLEAEMGISGANIAIAETGTLVIVSNEGNARLVTSLPDTHVALVGYDKLVPSIDEAAAIIKLLSKCGTGQKMTSYVSFITGPSRTSDIEKTLTLGCHGPKEVHIIFVDNGRLELLNDDEFREALYCVKCGACLNVCPVYRSVGGHVFGHTYVGGIGAILTAFYNGLLDAEEIVNICAACKRCTTYCPANIDIPRMIVGLRRKLAEKQGQPWLQQFILRSLLANPKRFDTAVKYARGAQGIFLPKAKGINIPFSGLTAFRNLPALAEKPLAERVPEVSSPSKKKKGTVVFYPGCLIDYVYPEVGESVIAILTRLGWEVRLPQGRGCCGIPALYKGDAETAAGLAKLNAELLQSADHVVCACPTCAVALKEELANVQDFTEFLVNTVQVTLKTFHTPPADKLVTYHDPCHAVHGLGISDEPRTLLQLAGYELVEMHEADVCCGFAGSHSMSYPEISESVFKRKLESILATGAATLVTACPGCLLQLRGGLEKAGSKVRVVHIAEILAERVK